MTQQTPRFDEKPLLNAFREMHTSAKEALRHVDTEYCIDYRDTSATMSATSAEAAQAAETALQELDAGDPTRARQYLDRMSHVMGMISLATHDPNWTSASDSPS